MAPLCVVGSLLGKDSYTGYPFGIVCHRYAIELVELDRLFCHFLYSLSPYLSYISLPSAMQSSDCRLQTIQRCPL